MAAKKNSLALERNNVLKGIKSLAEYLESEDITEDAKDFLALDFFRIIFGESLKKESAAANADGYVEGKLVIELKTKQSDWKSGLFQAIHYQKKGLTFSNVCVVSHRFVGLWKLSDLPEDVLTLCKGVDPIISASAAGKEVAKRVSKASEQAILQCAKFLIQDKEFDAKNGVQTRLFEFSQAIRNLEAGRIQINTSNFIQTIQAMARFFETPIDAVHAFYALIHYWDVSAELTLPGEHAVDNWAVQAYARVSGGRRSENILVDPKFHADFKKFVEDRYVFTNEGSGLTLDYYFSRFDEVLATIDPAYVKQHGIFFTDDHLSKFALWFVKHFAEDALTEKYIVLDPAGGSGNLVTSWRLNIKHKIVSELQPDLLRIIERRLKYDPLHLQQGFTIVPKTNKNEGLNFLDKSAKAYLDILEYALKENGHTIDKPFAFLVNPPYKSTDEREESRDKVQAEYGIDPEVLSLTGKDAGKERYATFLAQILLIAKEQYTAHPDWKPLLMVFTPTSWLVPRPSYKAFREIFDKHFYYKTGFIVNSREFFKLKGIWPVAFTVWQFSPDDTRINRIDLHDFTHWKKSVLEEVNWLETDDHINNSLTVLIKNTKRYVYGDKTGINELSPQSMFDFKRDTTKNDLELKVYGGLPIGDSAKRLNKKTYGHHDGSFIGFLDDLTPVRVRQDKLNRQSIEPNRIWLRLDNDVKSSNKTRLQNGCPDKYGYCAFDKDSSSLFLTWFSIAKFLNGHFPLATNQQDIWPPILKKQQVPIWNALVFAYAMSANRCIETTFEADNPVPGVSAVEVQNPLAPYLSGNFYNEVLAPHIHGHQLAVELVSAVKAVYDAWLLHVTKGKGRIPAACLADEPYFRYFSYPAYVGPNAGLVQIRTFAQAENVGPVLDALAELTKAEKALMTFGRSYLIEDLKYFA